MEESPAVMQEAAAVVRAPRMHKGLIVAGILAVLVIAAAFIAREQIVSVVSMYMLPAELKQGTFVSFSEEGAQTYEIHGIGYAAAASYAGVTALESARGASLTLQEQGTSIAYNGVVVPLTPGLKTDIALAPSGEVFAFALLDTTASSTPETTHMPRDPREWNLHVFYPKTNTTILLGEGVSPVFLDDTHMVWQTSLGIFHADLTSGDITLLLPGTTKAVHARLLVSPDRAHIARVTPSDSGTSRVSIYSFANSQLTPITDIVSKNPVLSYVLGNEALYSLELGMKHVELYTHSLTSTSKTRHLLTIPGSFAISRMLLATP